MRGRRSLLAFLTLALLVAGLQAAAAQSSNPGLWGRTNYFDVCNKGTIPVYFVGAYSYFNVLEFRTDHAISGWWEIAPGKCENTFRVFNFGIIDEGESFYIGFMAADEDGRLFEILLPPARGQKIRPTNQKFCVRLRELARRGSLAALSPPCGPGWTPMQFSLVYKRAPDPYRTNLLLKFTYSIMPTEVDLDERTSRVLDMGPAAPSKRKADAGVAAAIGGLVRDLVADLPRNVDEYKGSKGGNDPICGDACWRSKLVLPRTEGFAASAFVEEGSKWNGAQVTYRGHKIKLATSEDIGDRLKAFESAVSRNLDAFQANPSSTGEWFRCVDRARMDTVKVGSAEPFPDSEDPDHRSGFISVRIARIEFLEPQATGNPCAGSETASSRPVALGEAAIAFAVADVIADLVGRLPKGFDDLKGAPVRNDPDCKDLRCWRSTLKLSVPGAYAAQGQIAETKRAGWFKTAPLVFTGHSIALTGSAPMAEKTRELFANAVSLKLDGFESDGVNAWCRRIDERSADRVEIAGADRSFEIAVVRLEYAEPPENPAPCFRTRSSGARS